MIRRRHTGLLALVLLLVLGTLGRAPVATADELKPGYLELTQTTPTTWRLVWKAPLKAGLAGVATPDLPPDCVISAPHSALVGVVVATEETVTCARPLTGREIGLAGLETTVSDVLVRIAPLGQPVQAARLTAAETHVTVRAKPDRLNVARTYFVLGVEHILTGYDHLLFVVSLVLLLRTGWRIAKTVTSFTLAHSITLAGASLGFLGLPRAPVESTIALSIIFLAVEIVKSDGVHLRWSERYPWAVAFGFGLLHGFGFAGALAEIGLPPGETPAALLSFNLGVEAGQLMIVGTTLCVLAAVARLARGQMHSARVAAAYVIGALSSAWFIARTLV